jgi:hypothetical protein
VFPFMNHGCVEAIIGIEFLDTEGLLMKTHRGMYWSREKRVTPKKIFPYIKAAYDKGEKIEENKSQDSNWQRGELNIDHDYWITMFTSCSIGVGWSPGNHKPVENLDDLK